jgi:fluoride exporter
MKNVLLVFVGGGLGSVVRYGIGRILPYVYTGSFPWATLLANVLACVLLGWLMGLAFNKQLLSQSTLIFWTVGFCGGFSTFSTFSRETITLFESGNWLYGSAYVVGSVSVCSLATVAGMWMSK